MSKLATSSYNSCSSDANEDSMGYHGKVRDDSSKLIPSSDNFMSLFE